METHDFYLKRDCGGEVEILVDYELVAHGGELSGTHVDALQTKDQKSMEQRGRGDDRAFSNKDAKNDTKKDAVKIKNTLDVFSNIQKEFSVRDIVPSAYSIAFHLTWTLKTPFFSRAVDEFSAIDNPITRDNLSNYPVLHASGAKGMLRGILHGTCRRIDTGTSFRERSGNQGSGRRHGGNCLSP